MRAWYVLVRRDSGAIARANAMLRAHPASFPKATGFSATPSLHTGADDARTLRLYQNILWVVALALLVFALANLGVYQGARGADFTLRAGILAENGTGRGGRMLYALTEPLLLTLLAATVAVLTTPAMEGVLARIIDVAGMQPHLSVATATLVFAVALACAVLLVALRLSLHAGASRGTVHAMVQRLLDWLSMLQAAVAVLLLGAMIAVCGAWYRVLPKQVGYSLDHVQVYLIHAPKERHYPALQGRMGPALARLGHGIGGTAAVAGNLWPIPGGGVERITAGIGAGPQLPIHVNHVTPGYFRVLRMSPVLGRLLEHRDVGNQDAPLGLGVVISRKAQAMLNLKQDALGTLLEIHSWHVKGLLPVVGVVDAGSSGRDAGDNTLQPMLYMPYKGFNVFTDYILLVRYAQGMSLADVTRQVDSTMTALTPGARVVTSRSAQSYFNAATALERAAATLFMLLGAGALVYVFLAINGVALLRLAMDRHTLAIRHAIGETRQALVASLLRRLVVPMLIGAAVGAVLVCVAVPLLGQFFSGGTIATWKVLGLALLVFALCVASAMASGALRLRRAPLAEWLRNPD